MGRTKIREYGLQTKKEAILLLLIVGIKFCSQSRNHLFFELIDDGTNESVRTYIFYPNCVKCICELAIHKDWQPPKQLLSAKLSHAVNSTASSPSILNRELRSRIACIRQIKINIFQQAPKRQLT